jgi:subtilisin-like proprotein convertase family protein
MEIAPSVSGGLGVYTYDWLCNGNATDTYWFEPAEAGLWSCEVVVGDTCGVVAQSAFIEVEVIEILPPDNAFCGYEFLEGGAYIPDLAECFTRELEVAIGNPDAVISDVSDMSFFVNMEHSYMGDLTITFTCPNGQSLEVQSQGGGNTLIGIPDPLDGTGPGTGVDYYWSPLASNGTWTDNEGGELPTGIYESAAPFDLLQGCPQDGIWQISICDLWGSDDGWVFEWGVAFGDCAFEPGCTEPDACNYLPGTILDDGSCIFPGCTDESACNFDPSAGCDDGSCLLSGPELGCVDSNACNFDPNAFCSDGSCIYPLIGDDCMAGAVACSGTTEWDAENQICICLSIPNDCPTDLNGNGSVEVNDFLLFLGSFGIECPPE